MLKYLDNLDQFKQEKQAK